VPAGAALLGELADRLGLTGALGWRAGRTQTSRHRHDVGAVLRDLMVLLADGGDALSDLAVLREQPELFGAVASTPTAWRVIERIACDPDGLAGLRAARAHARAAAWLAGAHAEGLLVVDVDGTLLTPTPQSRARPGPTRVASASTRWSPTWTAATAPARPWRGSCGRATPAPTPPKITSRSSIWPWRSCPGPPERSRCWSASTLAAPPTPCLTTCASAASGSRSACQPTNASAPRCWQWLPTPSNPRSTPTASPARRRSRRAARPGPCRLAAGDPGGLPPRRSHPGAQLSFTDADGHRFQVFITDQPDADVATLELRHRRRARVEDRIRAAKATGLRNLPFDLWRRNAVWLELVLAAQDLTCWAQVLLLDGDLKVAEPKTLRYRLWHIAARVVRHARRLIVRLQRTWPWATALAAAFTRLRALPLRC
jgi:hypothetical protein